MTDMFIMDEEGNFSTGKASTTPHDESISFWEALKEAAKWWGIEWDKEAKRYLEKTELAIYSGTSMLNAVLQGKGVKCGLITTKGFEDMLVHERSRGAFAGYSYADRLHKVTHKHNEPMIHPRLVRGVRGRINAYGQEEMPLNEEDVRQATLELLEEGVEAIVVCFACSYLNPTHELRAKEIIEEVMEESGRKIPIHLSSQVCPLMREVSRVISTTIHAKVTDIARRAFLRIENKLKSSGYRYRLQVVLASGGLANANYPRLYETVFSGPIGGLIGTQYISRITGIPNWIATDLGGTSFDVGLVMGGKSPLLREVEVARNVMNIPTLAMDSIGAGTGSYVRYDETAKRVLIGPDSAGADPGPVCYNLGNEIPTVMDCMVVNGIINPDYYLGGAIKLDVDHAYRAIMEKCSGPADMDIYEFNQHVIDLISSRIREHVRTVVGVRGLPISDFCMLSYGGAGPILAASCSEGLGVRGVATIPFAAVFSAFGCACMDFVHHYQKSTLVQIPHNASEELKMWMGAVLNYGWDTLEEIAKKELEEEGIDIEKAKITPVVYMRYGMQLEDLEVPSPVSRIESPEDMDRLIEEFEKLYEKIYYTAAKYPEAGYTILEQGLIVEVPQPKPKLVKLPVESSTPSESAYKGQREVYWRGKWYEAPLYEMVEIRPGNRIRGMAIVEAPDTTLLIPPGWGIYMDELRMIWIRKEEVR
jgi:N-methylhydantoinase A